MRTAIIYVIAVLAYVASTLALYNQPIIETRLPLAACPNADSCLPFERFVIQVPELYVSCCNGQSVTCRSYESP